MPKVSYTEHKILGTKTRFEIYYNSTKLFHIPNFNTEVQRTTGVNVSFGFETEAALIEAVTTAIKEFHHIKSTKRKVIIYSISVSDKITDKAPDRDGWSSGKKKWAEGKPIQDIGGYEAYAFGIEYKVAFQVTGKETEYFSPNTDREYDNWNDDPELGHSFSIHRDDIVIDWTPEREAAFNDVCNSLAKLAEKAAIILIDPAKTIQLLESKQKLLV